MVGPSLAAAAITFTFLSGCLLVAPLLAPLDPLEQHDPAAGRLLPPGTGRYALTLGDGRRILAADIDSRSNGISVSRRGRSLFVTRQELEDPRSSVREVTFLLGTDHLGRDCLSRLLHGSRLSLMIGLAAALLAAAVGCIVGATAALSSAPLERFLMHLTDGLLAFPPLLLLILLLTWTDSGVLATIGFLSSLGWMAIARIVRAETRRLLESEPVAAARSVGSSPLRILWCHIGPHLVSPVAVATSLRFAEVMLLESALSFLGIGVPPPTPTLGGMIASGVTAGPNAPWILLVPGALLCVVVAAANALAEALRRRWQPLAAC